MASLAMAAATCSLRKPEWVARFVPCDGRRARCARGPPRPGAWLSTARRLAAMHQDGLVRLSLKRAFADGTIAVDMDPLSLLCRLATSVPPPCFHTVKYAGDARVRKPMAQAHRTAPCEAARAREACEAARAREGGRRARSQTQAGRLSAVSRHVATTRRSSGSTSSVSSAGRCWDTTPPIETRTSSARAGTRNRRSPPSWAPLTWTGSPPCRWREPVRSGWALRKKVATWIGSPHVDRVAHDQEGARRAGQRPPCTTWWDRPR